MALNVKTPLEIRSDAVRLAPGGLNDPSLGTTDHRCYSRTGPLNLASTTPVSFFPAGP